MIVGGMVCGAVIVGAEIVGAVIVDAVIVGAVTGGDAVGGWRSITLRSSVSTLVDANDILATLDRLVSKIRPMPTIAIQT